MYSMIIRVLCNATSISFILLITYIIPYRD